MSDTETYWYRYDDYARSDGTSVYLGKHRVAKETPKGVWLNAAGKGGRFVLRDARKRFACPTITEAKESFLARKTRQVSILRSQLRAAEAALAIAKGEADPGEIVEFEVVNEEAQTQA